MADMVYCRGCGAEIHRSAVSCPKCGAQQRTGRVKSKVAAGVLALLLGGLGVHRFYLGQWWGVFYVLFCWTGIPGLIGFIEGLVFLFSNDERWDAKYNQGVPSGNSAGAIIVAAVVAVFVLIAVMGILAAIAIPAYQDYTIRSQVAEGLNLAAEAKAAVAQALESGAAAPANRVAAGLPAEASGIYVSSVVIRNGRIDITYGGRANPRIAGHVLALTPYLVKRDEKDIKVAWRCGYGPVPYAVTHEVTEYIAGDMYSKYLPSLCR